MSLIITIIAFFTILGVLVLAHELGHFLTARASGVRVEEFGLGYPPRLFSLKKGEIIYSINLLPLGGFTKMAGEENPAIPGSLAGKSAGVRLLVLGAGAIINAILPVFLFAAALMVPHEVITGQVVIKEITPDSPAALSGMQPGERIVSINGEAINNLSDIQRYIQTNLGRAIDITLLKEDNTTHTVTVTPRWKPPAGQGAVGIVMEFRDPRVSDGRVPFWQVIPRALKTYGETIILLVNGIATMAIGGDAGGRSPARWR